jgi:hypothetical protein
MPASMSAAEPQHSLSLVQVSPSTWQPVAGWQTSMPVGPHGAHARLQQLPPHPPSTKETAVHSWPSTAEQLPPNVGVPQVPRFPPLGMVQIPLQQLPPFWQMSPVWPHHDDG